MTKGVMAQAVLSPCQQSHEFDERWIPLGEDMVKVGRSVARLKPSNDNSIFDCKVLSRNHAVIWYEDQRFYLKDTKSSNGTFVNNLRLSKGSEESPPKEIYSGDIIQFGVEIAENTKNVKHGCIIALVRLHHPDGSEATAPANVSHNVPSQMEHSMTQQPGATSNDPREVVFSALEVYQLQQYLREAAFREQAVEAKLANLQELIARTQDASQCSWQALIDEDRLLARIEMLEGQLAIHSKSTTDDKLREEVLTLRQQQNVWESQTKESLRRALEEKMEAIKELEDVERSLNTTESECTQLRAEVETAHSELEQVNAKHTEALHKICTMSQQIQDLEQEFKNMQQKFDAERRSLEEKIAGTAKSEADLVEQIKQSNTDKELLTKKLESVGKESEEETKKEESKVDWRVQQLTKQLEETQQQLNQYRTQVDSAQSDVHNGKLRLESMQSELEKAYHDVMSSNSRAQILDENIRNSNDQLGAVIDLASRDLTAQLDEALYQNDRSEDLVRCLKEFATQLEGRLRDLLMEGVAQQGPPIPVPLPVHLRAEEIMSSSDGSLPPSDPCSGDHNQSQTSNSSTADMDTHVEYIKDELAKAVQSQMLAETELKKYRDDLISARNGQRKSDIELQNIRLQLRERELLLTQSNQTVDRLNDQLEQEQVQKERVIEELELMKNNQADYQKKAQIFDLEAQQLRNRLKAVQEEIEFERSVKSTSSLDSENAKITLHKQAAKNQAEFATLKEDCSLMRQRILTVESEMKSSRKDNSKLQSEHRKLQEKYRNLEKMKEAMDANEKTWRNEACAAKVETDSTKSQLSEALEELERVTSCRSEQDMELRGLRRRLSLSDLDSVEDLALKARTITICSAIPLFILFVAIVVAFLPILSAITATRDPV